MTAKPTQADVQHALRILTAFAQTPEGYQTLCAVDVPIVILAAVERLTSELDRIAERVA